MNSIPWSSFRYPILLISLTAAVWACHPEAPQETGSQAPANGYPWLPDDLGPVPQILRPGELSTAIDKFNFTLSPGGDTVFYCATNQKLGFTAPAYQVWNGTAFDPPQWLPFAEAEIPMADVQMSSDGKQLFYSTFKICFIVIMSSSSCHNSAGDEINQTISLPEKCGTTTQFGRLVLN